MFWSVVISLISHHEPLMNLKQYDHNLTLINRNWITTVPYVSTYFTSRCLVGLVRLSRKGKQFCISTSLILLNSYLKYVLWIDPPEAKIPWSLLLLERSPKWGSPASRRALTCECVFSGLRRWSDLRRTRREGSQQVAKTLSSLQLRGRGRGDGGRFSKSASMSQHTCSTQHR